MRWLLGGERGRHRQARGAISSPARGRSGTPTARRAGCNVAGRGQYAGAAAALTTSAILLIDDRVHRPP